MTKRATLEAVEEVLAGTLGSVRVVDEEALRRGAYSGQTDAQLRMAVVVKARFEVEVVEDEQTGIVVPETADLTIDQLTLRVRLAFSTESELDDDARRDVRATCLEMADACRDALAWAGNLRATRAGDETGLAGHALNRRGPVRPTREDWNTRLFVAEFLMTGLIHRVRAIA